MLRRSLVLSLTILFLTACSDRLHNKESVQQAIVDRLQSHSGLGLKELDVTTTSVSFDKNKAYATVAFHPKSDPTVNSGMTMKYTLEEQSGKWVVTNVGDGQGHGPIGHGGMNGATLPPGHPQVNSGVPQPGAMESK